MATPNDDPGEQTPSGAIRVNVGGARFHLRRTDLNRQPDGRLANLDSAANYRHELNEYYFDRNPRAFEAIAQYYNTGKLHLPKDVCAAEFREELLFWKIDPDLLDYCCWARYQRGVRAKEIPPWSGYEGCHVVWKILENVHPSCLSKIYPVVSSLFIIMMTSVFSLRTMPTFKHYRIVGYESDYSHPNSSDWAYVNSVEEDEISTPFEKLWLSLHIICLIFFVVEIAVYLFFFVKELQRRGQSVLLGLMSNPIVLLDITTLVPFILYIASDSNLTGKLRHFETALSFYYYLLIPLKVFRILWFMRFWNLARAITYVIELRLKSIITLLLSLYVVAVFFSFWVHCAEGDSEESHFKITFDSLYYALITLTTVGYGDSRPIGKNGKTFGIWCCLCGVVFYALVAATVVPVLMNYFRLEKYARRTKPSGGRKYPGLQEEEAAATIPLEASQQNVGSSSNTAIFFTRKMTFEINKSCLSDVALEKFPTDSRCSYLLDGDTDCIAVILNYYRTGQLHVPQTICVDVLTSELQKWNIKPDVISECCWPVYKQSAKADCSKVDDTAAQGCMAKVLGVLENTNPNWYTWIYVEVSITMTFLVLLLPLGRYRITEDTDVGRMIWKKHLICFIYFILEFCLRFIFCPLKPQFLISAINILDILSLVGMGLIFVRVPQSVDFVILSYFPVNAEGLFVTLIALRGFHVLYFCRNVWLARSFCYTIKSGLKDFFFVLMLYQIFTFVFSFWIYYAESGEEKSQMKSIPHAIWWAYATITTVGYGDVTGVGRSGKSISIMCAITGVFMYSLIAGIVMYRFDKYNSDVKYRRVKKMSSCCRRTQPTAV